MPFPKTNKSRNIHQRLRHFSPTENPDVPDNQRSHPAGNTKRFWCLCDSCVENKNDGDTRKGRGGGEPKILQSQPTVLDSHLLNCKHSPFYKKGLPWDPDFQKNKSPSFQSKSRGCISQSVQESRGQPINQIQVTEDAIEPLKIYDYDIILYNCNVVDVEMGKIISNCCVVIADSKIARITPSRFKEQFMNLSRTGFDCKGSYVMPGLIDCHVHVTAFTANFALLENTSPAYVTARAIKTLREMLDRGFTTVRDAGGADHGLARAVEEGYVVGPRLLFCGKALSQTGGHGDMRLPGDFAKALSFELCQCCAGLGRVCDGDAEVRKAVRDEIRKGATHIKVMAGGGVSSPTDRITSTQFSLMELTAIVDEAKAANLHVMAHAYTPQAIVNAVKAGVRSIEHGNLLNEESAKIMAKAGTYLVPTLPTYDALAKEGLKDGLSQDMVKKVHDVLDLGKKSIAIAYKEKVTMCFGSDCLSDMRKHQLREFALLEEAGLPVEEILRTATVNAARLLGMEGKIGVIAEGATADILIVNQNPLLSTAVFNDIKETYVAILKEGQVHFSKDSDSNSDS